MRKKRKRRNDAEWLAHEARVEEHLGLVYGRVDRFFAARGEPRPADSAAYVLHRLGQRQP
jgi:hypothetical protein